MIIVDKSSVDQFLNQKKIAIIGVSRDSQQFANTAYRFLKSNGYTVFPINPYAERIEGDACYPNIRLLPERVDAALIFLPSEKVMSVLPAIVETGIKHIWLQQGTESREAIDYCQKHFLNVVYGECILMFAKPVGFPHRLHGWGNKIIGKYPK
jgi:predicted CoA-binding protein